MAEISCVVLFFRLFTILQMTGQNKHLLVTFGGEKICQENVVETLSDIQVFDTQLFIAYPPGMVRVKTCPSFIF